jgi:hypothetical protein
VNIHYDITHPNIQNLNLAVIRPGGALMNLYNLSCTSGGNINVNFDAEAGPFACGSPLAGNMQPALGLLASMYGNAQQGTWQFGFRDTVAGNAGTVNSFSIEICNKALILGTKNYEFQDFALYPNPNTGDFTIRFNSSTNHKINIAVHDMRGRKIFDNTYDNNGLFAQEIRLNNTQSGIYLVSVQDGDHKIVKRIVVE